LTSGNHGAVKLTKEQLGFIDDFAKTVSGRKLSDEEYDKTTAAASEQVPISPVLPNSNVQMCRRNPVIVQSCQIFLDTTYQNGRIYTTRP
jgi:hypothetical protein